MANFWRRHRRLTILANIVLAPIILIIVVPYLIPLGKNQTEVSSDVLVTENGKFLDIDGMNMHVEDTVGGVKIRVEMEDAGTIMVTNVDTGAEIIAERGF